jgi:hypothetical protein
MKKPFQFSVYKNKPSNVSNRIKEGIRFDGKIHFITHYQFIIKVLLEIDKRPIKKPEYHYSGFRLYD